MAGGSLALAGCAAWPDSPHGFEAGQAMRGQKVAALAQEEIGAPYRYGGSTPRGFDCSGLVYYLYRQVGVSLPRTAEAQYDQTARLTRSALLPGDLVFFFGGAATHVGIYLGAGRFVHAPETGKPVSFGSLQEAYWSNHYLGAGRPP